MTSATTLVGQAIGRADAMLARSRVQALLQTGAITGALSGVVFVCMILPLAFLYPNVGSDVLQIAAWSIVINGIFQAMKVRNMILGGGILPSGGDTTGILMGDFTSMVLVGLPLAFLLAFGLGLGVWGVFF